AGPIADRAAQDPAGDDIGLPMFLALEPRERVIGRQQLERPNPRIVPRVIGDERRDETGLQRDFAAGEAVAAPSLEPLIGIVALVGTRSAETELQYFRGDRGNHGGIDGLPQGVAQLIVVAQPERAADLRCNDAVFEPDLVFAGPDAVLIEIELVVDPGKSLLWRAAEEREQRSQAAYDPQRPQLCCTKFKDRPSRSGIRCAH